MTTTVPIRSRRTELRATRRYRVVYGPGATGPVAAMLVTDRASGAAETVALAAMGLSERQAQVVRLAARGLTNAEIAALIGISPRTVQKHLEHVYDRLGVRSRAGAAAIVIASLGGLAA